jgi:hypothetical protein
MPFFQFCITKPQKLAMSDVGTYYTLSPEWRYDRKSTTAVRFRFVQKAQNISVQFFMDLKERSPHADKQCLNQMLT